MKKIRVAIIGYGRMGQRYFDILDEIKLFKIECIIDKKVKKLKFQMKKNNVDFIFDNYLKLEKVKKKIDLVIISTTADVRYKIIAYCIKAGIKFILAEKPFCKSLNEASKIISLSKKNSSRILVNFIRRSSAVYKKINNQIKRKVIGRLKSITIQMGGGQFGSNGSHMTDLLNFLIDEKPLDVSGYLDNSKKNYRGKKFYDPGGYCLYRSKNNTRGIIDMLSDHSSPPTIFILGAKGRIFYDERDNFYLLYKRQKKDFNKPVSKRCNFKVKKIICESSDLKELTRRNILNLVSKKKIHSDLEDAFKSLEIILATYISNKNNAKYIKLPVQKKYYSKTLKFA